MSSHAHTGEWEVVAREGNIRLRTGRIGMFKVDATAPIVGGEADWTASRAKLMFRVGISEVKTGNRLLDPEVHALVGRGSDGVLTFEGTGSVNDDEVRFDGRAWAGDVEVPLTLVGQPEGDEGHARDVKIAGTATFDDIHIPLPGFSSIRSVDVEIDGLLKLIRATAVNR